MASPAPLSPSQTPAPACVALPSLALMGGGIRSVSMFTGLTAGLLRVAADVSGSGTGLQHTRMYARFAALCTVSGGSWFTAGLVYTDRFRELVESMAASPWRAADLFRRGWTEPLLAVTVEDGPFVKLFAKLAEFVDVGLSQDLLLAGYLCRTGFTWTNFVKTLLEAAFGVDPTAKLGDPVQEWAIGKKWLLCHNLLTPSKESKMSVAVKSRRGDVEQTLKGGSGLFDFAPAAYSVVLGSGKPCCAPVPYVTASAVPASACWRYSAASTASRLCLPGHRWTVDSGEVGSFDNFTLMASDLPVLGCAAASSAILAPLLLCEVATDLLGDLAPSATVWQGCGSGEDAFQRPMDMVEGLMCQSGSRRRDAVAALAGEAVCATADGGSCDSTGIATAVRAGSREVVAYIVADENNYPYQLAKLFPGSFPGEGLFMANLLGSSLGSRPPAVFKQDAAEVFEAFTSFPSLRIAAGVKFLKSICLGSLEVTTTDCPLWGISEGISVTLHLVGVSASVSIGFLQDLHDYDVLAQEIIACITSEENAAIVQGTLLPWVL